MKRLLKNITFLFLVSCVFIATAACSNENNTFYVSSTIDTVFSVPFFTKNKRYTYVDKRDLNPIKDQIFFSASLFTATGFAVVENENHQYAIIDQKGSIKKGYLPGYFKLNAVNGITFYAYTEEYEKEMPFWNWDWNILGGGVTKERTYHKVEIGILETNQVLLKKDVQYDQDDYSINAISVDEHHFFWNGQMFEVKNGRVNSIDNNIIELLDERRFIKRTKSEFSIYQLGVKGSIQRALKGSESISIKLGDEMVVLNEINTERFTPIVPKLLIDEANNAVYPFPQYDKPFPPVIRNATSRQVRFIKDASLIYSITNSPYFLLGIFNYDNNVWAFEWMYIDKDGNVFDTIDFFDFKVLDQFGGLVWPDRKMILPNGFIDENWKFGSIISYGGEQDIYRIPIENERQERTVGLWSRSKMTWEIKPLYHDIMILDFEKGICAIKKNESDLYKLYDSNRKVEIGANSYQSINSDGLVSVKCNSDNLLYYYIDIHTGKEYREQ